MTMSLNSLTKLNKEELSKMVLEDQNKFDNVLSDINNQLNSLRERFTKM